MPIRSVQRPVISADSQLHPLDMSGNRQSFVSRPDENNPLRVLYYYREPEKHVVAHVLFSSGAKGPPGHAHGGSMAAVFDETMGTCAWYNGYPVLAAGLEVSFRAPLPLETATCCEAWVEEVTGRKVRIAAMLFEASDPACVFGTARGLFVSLPIESFARPAKGGELRR